MAVLSPVRTAGLANTAPIGTQLTEDLRPWRRRLTQTQVVRGLRYGVSGGILLASLILIIARLIPWAQAPFWAIALGVLAPLLALFLAFWYRPSLQDTARKVDRELKLHDRLGTAWELREQSSVLAGLQRRDALQQLGRHTPKAAFPHRISRLWLMTFLGLSLALTLLIVLPNPMLAILKQQAILQAHVAKQVKSIEQTRQAINKQADIPAEEKQKIDQILQDLEKQLQNAKNETEAQQALANAQAKLDQLHKPQAANHTQAVNAAGQSLQNSSNGTLKSIGQALSGNDTKSLDQSLQQLQSDAKNL